MSTDWLVYARIYEQDLPCLSQALSWDMLDPALICFFSIVLLGAFRDRGRSGL
jgi:hypothetical protein